jgi:putative peptide zinc metalloprotease protein
VAHAGQYQAFYPPAPSEITAVNIRDGQAVEKGQILATLRSPDLDYKIRAAQRELQTLETLRRRGQADQSIILDPALSDAAVQKARVNLATLEGQQRRLILTAPFSGIVRDVNMELQAGRFIRTDEKMFVLINPQSGTVVTAYAPEEKSDNIRKGARAVFMSFDRATRVNDLRLVLTSAAGQSALDWPELASPFGGPVAAERGSDGQIVPRRSLYMVQTSVDNEQTSFVQVGYLKVQAAPESIFINFIKWLGSLARQEAKLG